MHEANFDSSGSVSGFFRTVRKAVQMPESVIEDSANRGDRNQSIAGRFVKFSSAVGGINIAAGAYVLLGWCLDIDALKNPFPLGPAIKANCAVAFVLMGSSLLLFLRSAGTSKSAYRWPAGVALGLSALSLSQYFTGGDLGLDQLLFADSETPSHLAPGRMAPNTALAISLCAVSMLTAGLSGRHSRFFSQITACAAACVCLLGSLGHLYGVSALCKFGVWSEMKFSTAILLSLLSFGIFCAQPKRALAGIITHANVGGLVARYVLPAVAAIPLFVGWLRLAMFENGLVDAHLGTAILVVAITAAFAALVLRISHTLNEFDEARSLSEAALHRSEDRLQRSEEKYRLLWESSPEAVLIMERSARVCFANAAVRSILGMEPNAVIGRSLEELLPRAGAVLADEISHFCVTEACGLNWRAIELQLALPDGRVRSLEASLSHMVIGGEHMFATFMRDVSERKEVDRVKSEFISVVSHELRTPMTAIYGSLSLMEGGLAGTLSEEATELVQIARSSAGRLILLINDILDLNKIEAGKLELKKAKEDPLELATTATRGVQCTADQMSVSIRIAGEANLFIGCDRNRIVQVLTNLISNAIKFSGVNSTVTVNLSTHCNYVRFEITDQGPGIPKEQIPLLFQKFNQLDASDSRSAEGTGLGLAISKSLVEMHEGRIGVESPPGQGATFWFELPLSAKEASSSNDALHSLCAQRLQDVENSLPIGNVVGMFGEERQRKIEERKKDVSHSSACAS